MQVFLTTTGTLSPVAIDDIGKRPFVHPTTDYELTLEYTPEELRYSADLQSAIDSGYITLEDGNGNSITDVESQITFQTDHGALIGLSDDDHAQYIKADGTRAFSGVVSGITPTLDAHLTTKQYVDNAIQTETPLPNVLHSSEETEDTTTSTTYVQAWRYSPILAQATYIIQWYAELRNETRNKDAEFKVELNDTTILAEVAKSFFSEFAGWAPVGGFYVYANPTAGTINLDMDFRALSATAAIRRKRFAIIEIAS